MLSRRSVRVKVMQLLYEMGRSEDLTFKAAKKLYQLRVDMSYELFMFNLYTLVEVTKYAEEDNTKRKSKHIPSDYDRFFKPKIVNNEIIQDLINNKVINKVFDKYDFKSRVTEDYISKIYYNFSKTDSYKEFVLKADYDKEDIIEILLEMYRFCRQNEFFNDMMEDSIHTWIDDKSLVVGVVKKYIKQLPNDDQSLFKSFEAEDETVSEFGDALFDYVHKESDKLLEHVKPVLENWDHERLAIIDMILLKMAIAEFFIFPTIPVNVTINEYVEVAKKYSTAKSKDFINGILDKLALDLNDKGLIKKAGRGLLEN